jgi:putative ABC transport system substrate-binding protein
LTLQLWEVRSGDDFEKVFAALNKERPDGLYMVGSASLMATNRKPIAALVLKSRLPSMHANKSYVEVGGLMSYSADQAESYRRVAYFVDRILKGTKPAELPVEQPMRFELVVNLKTAKQIGVTVDPNLLARANRIIK